MFRRFGACACLSWLVWAAAPASATDFYVAVNGTSGTGAGTGTFANPWKLATAFSPPAAIKPGDNVWIRGGTYTGRYLSMLAGTPLAPVRVRPYPGERVRIDGGPGPLQPTLSIAGQYTWYQGLEVFSSDTKRRSSQNGSAPTDLNRGSCIGIAQDMPHLGLKLLNMVLHDGTDAIGSFATDQGSEISGNVVSNNGWDGATDRGHGNGIYAQNQTGAKRILNNFFFNNYAEGIQIYGSSTAFLDDIEVTGNAVFTNGSPSVFGCARNILFGGDRIASSGQIVANTFYLAPSGGACTVGGANVGYNAGADSFLIESNWFSNGDGGFAAYFFGAITNLTMTNNDFVRDISGDISASSYPLNTYHHAVRPTGTNVFVRPNDYEVGRANVVILNWDLLATVSVDVSAVLAVGALYELRNAADFYGPPVLTGVYAGGSLAVPMTGLSVARPIGGPALPSTGPEFGAFVLLSQPAGTAATTTKFFPATPCRLVDTRLAPSPLGGPALPAYGTRVFPLAASSCVLPAGVKALALNVTAVSPGASGQLHVYPGDLLPSAASMVAFRSGHTRAVAGLQRVATDGSGSIGVANDSPGSVHVLVDVTGYFK